jgi:hypothetical protein
MHANRRSPVAVMLLIALALSLPAEAQQREYRFGQRSARGHASDQPTGPRHADGVVREGRVFPSDQLVHTKLKSDRKTKIIIAALVTVAVVVYVVTHIEGEIGFSH